MLETTNTHQQTKAHLDLVLKHLHGGIWEWDLITGKHYFSKTFSVLLGYDEAYFSNTIDAFKQLLVPEDVYYVFEVIEKHIASGDKDIDIECRIKRKKGDIRWFRLCASVIRNDINQPLQVIGILSDIHELKDTQASLEKAELALEENTIQLETQSKTLKDTQEQLSQKQKVETIGKLAGGVAHEFNNLLCSMMGYTELLQEIHAHDEHSMKFLNTIYSAGKQGSDLTQQILAYARKEKHQLTAVNLNELVTAALGILEHSIPKTIDLETALSVDDLMISADTSQILQLIMNLAINAKDAMTQGGDLCFKTKLIDITDSLIETHPQLSLGKYACLQVSDTGTGISKEMQQRIFEPFFTTKEAGKGTGLGLAMIDSVVKGHQGAITIDSKENQGTCFNIYLPIIIPDKQSKTTNDKQSSAALLFDDCLANKTLLIVDDEIHLRELTKHILQPTGADLIFAEDGAKAIETYTLFSDQIDMILLDVLMPKVDGIDVFHQIRKVRTDVPVLFASGYTESNEIRNCRQFGNIHFIQKPFEKQALFSNIQQLLNL